ncbi:hypothetical protein U1Q18_046508, partial [Sarracenia purpurea var. burkii]
SFEGDPSEITSLCEVQYREHILEETLERVRTRRQVLEAKYEYPSAESTSQVCQLPTEDANANGFVTRNPNHILDWLPQRDPQVQIMNFLDSNGLLPLREHSHGIDSILPPSSSFLHGRSSIQMEDQNSPSSGGMDDDDHIQRSQFRQAADVNLAPWTDFYPTVTGSGTFPGGQPRERGLLELFLSQLTP